MSSSYDFEFAAFDDFQVKEEKKIEVTSNSYTVNTDYIQTSIDTIFNLDLDYIKHIPDDMIAYVIDENAPFQ